MIFFSSSPPATRIFAQEIFRETERKGIRLFLLEGDLGSGKTVFVQGLAKALGVKKAVKSPSFILISEHSGKKKNLIHADLYRLDDPKEILGLDLAEYLDDPRNILAIEWAEKLPKGFLRSCPHVRLKFFLGKKPNERKIVSNVQV